MNNSFSLHGHWNWDTKLEESEDRINRDNLFAFFLFIYLSHCRGLFIFLSSDRGGWLLARGFQNDGNGGRKQEHWRKSQLEGEIFQVRLTDTPSPQKEKSKLRSRSISVFVIIIFLSFSISFRIVPIFFYIYKLYQYFSLSLDISFLYKSFFLLFVSLFISFFFYFVWFFHCFLLLPCLSFSDVALITVMTLILNVFIWNFERKFHLISFSFFRTA